MLGPGRRPKLAAKQLEQQAETRSQASRKGADRSLKSYTSKVDAKSYVGSVKSINEEGQESEEAATLELNEC